MIQIHTIETATVSANSVCRCDVVLLTAYYNHGCVLSYNCVQVMCAVEHLLVWRHKDIETSSWDISSDVIGFSQATGSFDTRSKCEVTWPVPVLWRKGLVIDIQLKRILLSSCEKRMRMGLMWANLKTIIWNQLCFLEPVTK